MTALRIPPGRAGRLGCATASPWPNAGSRSSTANARSWNPNTPATPPAPKPPPTNGPRPACEPAPGNCAPPCSTATRPWTRRRPRRHPHRPLRHPRRMSATPPTSITSIAHRHNTFPAPSRATPRLAQAAPLPSRAAQPPRGRCRSGRGQRHLHAASAAHREALAAAARHAAAAAAARALSANSPRLAPGCAPCVTTAFPPCGPHWPLWNCNWRTRNGPTAAACTGATAEGRCRYRGRAATDSAALLGNSTGAAAAVRMADTWSVPPSPANVAAAHRLAGREAPTGRTVDHRWDFRHFRTVVTHYMVVGCEGSDDRVDAARDDGSAGRRRYVDDGTLQAMTTARAKATLRARTTFRGEGHLVGRRHCGAMTW